MGTMRKQLYRTAHLMLAIPHSFIGPLDQSMLAIPSCAMICVCDSVVSDNQIDDHNRTDIVYVCTCVLCRDERPTHAYLRSKEFQRTHHYLRYYFMITPQRAVTFWVPLDDADEANGCLVYVKGSSHKVGLCTRTLVHLLHTP